MRLEIPGAGSLVLASRHASSSRSGGARSAWLLVLLVALATVMSAPRPERAEAISTDIVLSQVYGGGGNSGAPFTHDFVELFNLGSTPVDLAGWSIQYGSAAGVVGGSGIPSAVTPLSGILQPGQFLLVQEESGGGTGTPLPEPDVVGSIAMGSTAGKVALANTTASLNCTSCAFGPGVVDFVGYGTANDSESFPTGATSNISSVARSAVCQDTDSNFDDFLAQPVDPRNGSVQLQPCGSGAVVAHTNPADGAVGVPVGANLVIAFNQNLAVEAASFEIVCDGVPITLSLIGIATATWELDPDVDLPADVTCIVTIVGDLVLYPITQTPIGTDYVFSFSTSPGSSSGSLTTSITADLSLAACLILDKSSVNYGSLPFSTPATPQTATGVVTIDMCSLDGQQVLVRGDDATSADEQVTWALTQTAPGADNMCYAGGGINQFGHEVSQDGLDTVKLTTANQTFLSAASAGESIETDLAFRMPCTGSDGAGKVFNASVTFTALVP